MQSSPVRAELPHGLAWHERVARRRPGEVVRLQPSADGARHAGRTRRQPLRDRRCGGPHLQGLPLARQQTARAGYKTPVIVQPRSTVTGPLSQLSFKRVIPLAVLLGVMVGVFSSLFYLAWHLLHAAIWDHLPDPVNRIWVSTLIGLAIGLFIQRFWDPGTMSDIIKHFHHKGELPLEDNYTITPISLVGLVGGSSAGPEGVLTQVCGSMGSWLAKKFGPDLMRILTQAGMGAGFGAFLGAPIGGAILWLEMPHKKGMEYYESLIPTLVTSMVGFLVMAALLDVNLVPLWHLSASPPFTNGSMLAGFGVGLVAGGAAIAYTWGFKRTGSAFKALPVPIWVKTSLAGLLIGTLGWVYPLTYFYGRYQIDALLNGHFTLLFLLGMLVAKMLAASITINGHWQGGLIVPHIFMGACVGKAVAMAVPGVDPVLAMLCGMAAFNAAATQTPLASALIVIALSGFGGSIPIFLASLVGFFLGQPLELMGYKGHRTEAPGLLGHPHAASLVPAAAMVGAEMPSANPDSRN